MKFRYWLTIGFIFSSLSCWAADNEAYIDQLGDYSTIYVEQDGSANKLIGVYGPSMPSNPSKIYGDGINVDIRQVGMVAAIETTASERITAKVFNLAMSKGVFLRPLGSVIYAMPPYCVSIDEIRLIFNAIRYCVDNV